MSVFEIVSGVLLILSSIVIVAFVLMQESKGRGLSGVIGGGEMNENRQNGPGGKLEKYTKVAAVAFFVLAIAVGVVSVYFS